MKGLIRRGRSKSQLNHNEILQALTSFYNLGDQSSGDGHDEDLPMNIVPCCSKEIGTRMLIMARGTACGIVRWTSLWEEKHGLACEVSGSDARSEK